MSSFSSITRMQGCQRKALFGMIMGKYRVASEALLFGTAFHKSLEEGLEAGISELRKQNLRDSIPLLQEMWMRQTRLFASQEIDILAHELDFEIKLDGLTEPFRGFIDGLCEWRGEIWLMEFKTARYIDVSHIPVDSQITAYLWACRETGLAEPKGVLYFINQKSMDKPPVVLASGHLSTAKNQGCTYEDYLAKAVELYGDEIPPKVELFAEWLEKNQQPKLVMVTARRTEEQLDNFGEMVREYVAKEQELKKLLEEKGATRAVKECKVFIHGFCMKNCDYSDVCKSMHLDDSVDLEDMTEEKYTNIIN